MSNFIDYPELFIEDTELNSMIRLLDTQGYRNLLVQMTETFGIFKRVRDNGFTALQVYNSSSGEIGVYAGLAFDNSGNFINVKNNLPDLFAIPNDNTYRRVFIQYAQTQVEVGTINIAINGTITGVGTLFTQIFKPGKNIEIINSTHGNNGVYEVLSVNNDTLMLVNFNFVNAENNLNFKFQGVYTPSVTIPDSNKRPYWYDSYLITLQADNITETDSMFCLGRVINSLGVLTITDVRDKIHLFKSSYIPEFNSAYTTASTFKVGALTGGTGGQEVLLENTNYQVPKFPRINDISGFNLKNLDASFTTLISTYFLRSYINKLSVKFKWGYDDLVGTGGLGTFTTTNYNSIQSGLRKSFTTNELTGYFLYIPSLSITLAITGNVSSTTSNTVINVTNLDGTTWDGTGLTVDSSNQAWIHSNADAYELVAIPINSGNYDYLSKVESSVSYSSVSSPVYMQGELILDVGTYYRFFIRTIKGINFSSWVEMVSWQYTKYSITQLYLEPFMVQNAIIAGDGALSVLSTSNGFSISISGWAYAEMFEVAWTTDNGGVNFNNPPAHQQSMVTASRYVDITVSITANYSVSVRPLIGGQQVSPPLTKTIISGTSGVPPQDIPLLSTYIQHFTYSGSATCVSITPTVYQATVVSVVAPSLGTISSSLSSTIVGDIFTDVNNNDFMIQAVAASNILYISNLVGNSYTPANGNFTIGVSKRARLVVQQNQYTINYILTRIDVDCDVLNGQNVTVRVYQTGNESAFDSILISATDQPFTQDIDVALSDLNGSRDLSIDLFDPALIGALNNGAFSGRITIYARPDTSYSGYYPPPGLKIGSGGF